MTGRLAGKSALVTGAASGFGAAIAKAFAREGARVTILDLNEAGGARVAAEIGATALLESFMGLPDTPENREKFIASISLGRLSEPGDVAGACLYLASDEAGFVTGVVLEVDGGRTV